MFKPSELHAFLERVGTRAKKSLSQNFLIDGNILNKIIAVSDLHPGEQVLEIGPGPGALTQKLLQTGADVFAVEKDRVLAQNLPVHPHLKVYEQDIQDFDLKDIRPKAKIIANLPYHLTSMILGRFAPRGDLFSKMVVMVQHEVALRMTAKAGTKDYSSLSVFLHFYGTPHYSFKVSRRSFSPAPKIDSAIVVIDLQEKEPPEGFFTFVKTAFHQKRKMITSSLGAYGKERVREALSLEGFDPEARPATLSVDNWLKLYQHLTIGGH